MLIKLWFISFFLFVLWIKNLYILPILLPFMWIVSHKNIIILNKKVLKSILFFNTSISFGYLIMAYFQGLSPWHYLIYINLKVYLLTYFVFWFFKKQSIVQFFSFSKDMSYLLTITLSQIYTYKKTFEDFHLAYKSRVIKDIKKKRIDFIQIVFQFFFKKSMHDSHNRVLAMKARGFFD